MHFTSIYIIILDWLITLTFSLSVRISPKSSELPMVMSVMIVSFLFYLWFSYFGGVEPQGVYWDLSLAPYVHVTVDLYTFLICTYHFTCSIILVLWVPIVKSLVITIFLREISSHVTGSVRKLQPESAARSQFLNARLSDPKGASTPEIEPCFWPPVDNLFFLIPYTYSFTCCQFLH